MWKYFLYSKQEAVAVVQFNRPDALNAFNLEMLDEMDEILEKLHPTMRSEQWF